MLTTANMVARSRSNVNRVSVSRVPKIRRHWALSWGVWPWDKPLPTRVTMSNFVALGQTVWTSLGVDPRILEMLGPALKLGDISDP